LGRTIQPRILGSEAFGLVFGVLGVLECQAGGRWPWDSSEM
jgi:hypothetical protein